MRLTYSLLTVAALTLPAATNAAGLGERLATEGKDGIVACQTCHQPDGSGNASAGYPRLAGMNADYMQSQLEALKSGARQNAVMKPMASALSTKEMAAVSGYYARMDPPTAAPGDSGEKATLGQAIAERGLWRKGVPACSSCHGPSSRGVGADFPALAGQHANYITAQIKAWQQDKRSNDPNGLMAAVADRLTEAEAEAAAAYFASLPAVSPQD